MSFAYLVYASAWLKRYHPAAFCAALLNAQPMGFYSPQSLVDDARRHGVDRPPSRHQPERRPGHAGVRQRHPVGAAAPGSRRTTGGWAGRPSGSGLAGVRTLGADVAERIEAERAAHGPYRDMADLARRVGLTTAHLEALATADAFACFGLTRREALWAAGAAAQESAGPAARHRPPAIRRRPLPGMDEVDRARGRRLGHRPLARQPPDPVRPRAPDGDRRAAGRRACAAVEHGQRVLVGGIVTHRQRPATAGGITFINLEDETGMLNVTCSPGLWQRFRRVARRPARP